MNIDTKFIIKATKALYHKTSAKTIGIAKIKLYGDSPLGSIVQQSKDLKAVFGHNMIYNETNTSLNAFSLTQHPPGTEMNTLLTYKRLHCDPNAYGFFTTSADSKLQWLSNEALLIKKEHIETLKYHKLLQTEFLPKNKEKIIEHMLESDQTIDLLSAILLQ